jgi:hypothetical protein
MTSVYCWIKNLTQVTININILRDVTPCSTTEVHWRLGRTYCLRLQSRRKSHVRISVYFLLVPCLAYSLTVTLQNADELPDHKVSHPISKYSSLPTWLIWLRIGTTRKVLWTPLWNVAFHKTWHFLSRWATVGLLRKTKLCAVNNVFFCGVSFEEGLSIKPDVRIKRRPTSD